MKSLEGIKTLEETIKEKTQLNDLDSNILAKLNDDTKNNIIIQRLRGELRKYLNRPLGCKEQINYIQNMILSFQMNNNSFNS